MLTTYYRIMNGPRVTRSGSVTYDNRSEHELVKQLQAEVEALRARLKQMAQQAAIVACVMLTLAACTSHVAPVRNSHVWDAATIVQPQQDYLLGEK